jgi:hypothetical protein
MEAISAFSILSLPLFMPLIGLAYHAQHAVPPHDNAMLTNSLHTRTHLHDPTPEWVSSFLLSFSRIISTGRF